MLRLWVVKWTLITSYVQLKSNTVCHHVLEPFASILDTKL